MAQASLYEEKHEKAFTDLSGKCREDLPFSQFVHSLWEDELCAEHNGRITSFESLHKALSNIGQYRGVLARRTKRNLWKGTKTVALIGVSAGGSALVARGVAPHVAAALGKMNVLGNASTGTAIKTLNGAALRNASVYAIGQSGLQAIVSVGALVGGVEGGLLAQAYIGEVRNFDIRTVKRGGAPTVLTINGFLTEKQDKSAKWKPGVRCLGSGLSWYHVPWESKTKFNLGKWFASGGVTGVGKKKLTEAAMAAANAAEKSLGFVNKVQLGFRLARNPWHVSMVKAEMTGLLVADAIARTNRSDFVLLGHSLGTRVIYYALASLAERDICKVRKAILLGGAVGKQGALDWAKAASATQEGIHNCFSSKDNVLRYLYKTFAAGWGAHEPIGLAAIPGDPAGVVNHDFSELINGHNDWQSSKLEQVIRTVCE
jgi:hypothetical protein